ncbi:hypothetical protein TNCT_674461 [Trichonephila clavata]|uniref:Uncharacterized protein n=1 Tax=Trichonephila clavata TaxID=2740835 RepID=A0A8X6FKE0_TRICU|nr:hypothetical protein TNCT_674461 [Trichonephila clavata]
MFTTMSERVEIVCGVRPDGRRVDQNRKSSDRGRRGGGIHYALRNSISVDPSRLRLFGKGKEKPLLEYAGAAQPVWWLCPSACYRVGSGSRLEWKAANPFCLCWMYTCMKHTSTTTLLYMCGVSLSQRSMNVVATSRVNI